MNETADQKLVRIGGPHAVATIVPVDSQPSAFLAWPRFVHEDSLEHDALISQRQHEQRITESRERWARWLGGSGIPSRLHAATFEQARDTIAVTATSRYLNGDTNGTPFARGECLVLAGPTGVGKTYAGVCVLTRLCCGRLWYFGALAGALLDPARRVDALASCKADSLLVLDDLGTEYVKDGGLVQSFLDEIIWHREGNCLPTIITTNLPANKLAERIGDRIADRLRGPWGRIVECPGESLR